MYKQLVIHAHKNALVNFILIIFEDTIRKAIHQCKSHKKHSQKFSKMKEINYFDHNNENRKQCSINKSN